MVALGTTAFNPELTPFVLYSAAAEARTEEDREVFEEFAADMAEIQSLPEVDA